VANELVFSLGLIFYNCRGLKAVDKGSIQRALAKKIKAQEAGFFISQ